MNDHLQSSQGSRQLDHIFSRDLRSQYTLIEVFVQLQLQRWVNRSSILNRANNSATTFQSYKDKLATYDGAMITSIGYLQLRSPLLQYLNLLIISFKTYGNSSRFIVGLGLLLAAVALCRHDPWKCFLVWLRWKRMQTLSKLTKLLDQHIHSQILIAGFSFHIISILLFIFVEKRLHSVAWKEHDATHHSAKVLPMKNMSCAISITQWWIMYMYAICLCS